MKKLLVMIILVLILAVFGAGCYVFLTPEEEAKEYVIKDVEVSSDEDIINGLDMLMIGDSVTLGAQESIEETFPEATVDAKVSRQSYHALEILEDYQTNQNWHGDCFIFALGINGYMSNSLEEVREALPDDVIMFVFTLYGEDVDFAADNNLEIREFAESNDNVYLIDWENYSKDHDDWFTRDGVHLQVTGMDHYSDCMKQYIIDVMRTKTHVNEHLDVMYPYLNKNDKNE